MKDTTPLRLHQKRGRLSGGMALWYGILFLFFFQLLSDFVAAVYALGLLGTTIPIEIVAVLLLFTPALLMFARNGPGMKGQLVLVALVLLSAVVELVLDTRGRMLISGIGIGSCLLLLPTLLFDRQHREEIAGTADIEIGASLGLALSIGLRAWNSGVDPALQTPYRVIEVALAVVAGWLFWHQLRQIHPQPGPIESPKTSFRVTAGSALGWVAALTLLYFAFVSPNVIARWTGGDYRLVLGLIVLALAAFTLVTGFAPKWIVHLPRRLVLLWNVAFIAVLTATLLAYQIRFPADPSSYPFAEPPAPVWSPLVLLLTCTLFPVILVDLSLYGRELIAQRPSIRTLGGGFALASLFLLVMLFAQVFTTVYDYIPVVGPLFRDQFWTVFFVIGLALMLPLLLIRRNVPSTEIVSSKAAAGLVVFIGVAALVGALWRSSAPPTVSSASSTLRVLTYNIQQGYSAAGQLNYAGQLALMQQASPDIIGLEESDTNRIAGGNSDLVRYFADSLGFYSYYGPKTVAGTFGIALLSRYPIENPHTVYLYSVGEQTAAIVAQITVGGKRFNVFVTHLGNEGPIVQQQAFLQAIAGSPSIIAMGDFNFQSNGEQYRLTRTVLDDAWLLRWPQGVDDQGYDPRDSIDHLFVSPGMAVKEARFLTAPESDHPALLAEINW